MRLRSLPVKRSLDLLLLQAQRGFGRSVLMRQPRVRCQAHTYKAIKDMSMTNLKSSPGFSKPAAAPASTSVRPTVPAAEEDCRQDCMQWSSHLEPTVAGRLCLRCRSPAGTIAYHAVLDIDALTTIPPPQATKAAGSYPATCRQWAECRQLRKDEQGLKIRRTGNRRGSPLGERVYQSAIRCANPSYLYQAKQILPTLQQPLRP